MAINQQPGPSLAIVAKVTRTINQPVSDVFSYIVPVDIPHIFPRQGLAPGVVANTVTTEWGTAGQQRVTTFDDGSTIDETLLTVVPDKSFSYLTENFTSPAMKGVVDRIEGAWEFKDNGNDTTSIEWIYELVPASEGTRSVIIEKMLPVYRDRLETAMTILKTDLEILGKR
jgi:Polyketide cyclase / dehydrase and lipid transport